jgi:cystathionine beta-lyase
VTAAPGAWAKLRQTTYQLGQTASPDDAWLGSRGLRTMGLRLARHQENGLAVARWLADQPEVARVLHPALPGCPGHELWQRDFQGASGLFSFVLNGGDDPARARLIDGLALFGIGFSWGGFESLVIPADPQTLRSVAPWSAEGPLVRLHIGLEDPADLIADLRAGLDRFAQS